MKKILLALSFVFACVITFSPHQASACNGNCYYGYQQQYGYNNYGSYPTNPQYFGYVFTNAGTYANYSNASCTYGCGHPQSAYPSYYGYYWTSNNYNAQPVNNIHSYPYDNGNYGYNNYNGYNSYANSGYYTNNSYNGCYSSSGGWYGC